MINKTKPNQKRETGSAEESIKPRKKKIKKKNSTNLTQNEKDSLTTSAPGTWTLELGIRSRASFHFTYSDVGVSRMIFNTWYSASSKQYDIQVEELESGGGGGQLEQTPPFVRILSFGSVHWIAWNTSHWFGFSAWMLYIFPVYV